MDHRLILSSNQYTYNYSNLSGEWMNSILFGNQDGFNYYFEHPERDVRGKISSLFWYVYYVEEKGLSDKQLRSAYGNLRSVQQLLFKNGDGDDPQNKIGISMAQQVRRALEEGRGSRSKSCWFILPARADAPEHRTEFVLKSGEPDYVQRVAAEMECHVECQIMTTMHMHTVGYN